MHDKLDFLRFIYSKKIVSADGCKLLIRVHGYKDFMLIIENKKEHYNRWKMDFIAE